MAGTIFSCPRTVGAAPTIPAAAAWGRARWGSSAPFLSFALVVSYYSEPNFPGFLTVSELGTERVLTCLEPEATQSFHRENFTRGLVNGACPGTR